MDGQSRPIGRAHSSAESAGLSTSSLGSTCGGTAPSGAPRITVIIATRNRSHLLGDALRSVLNQTRAVAQIVVVDDSSDETHWREVQRLATQSDRIALHRQPRHHGASAARNVGLASATGDYIQFLDDDDMLEPQTLERSGQVLDEAASVDAVMCGVRVVQMAQGQPVPTPWGPPAADLESRPISAILRHSVALSACMVRRTAIGNVRFREDLSFGEDQHFWLSLAHRGVRFAVRNAPDAIYRRHADNTTASRTFVRHSARQLCRTLLASGMLQSPADLTRVHFKLAYYEWTGGRAEWRWHLRQACRHPGLLLRELVFYGGRLFHDPLGFGRYHLRR
jgi:glycosyltransferase involved in cell wall biosynthesis